MENFKPDLKRLERTIEELASIGKDGIGITRLPLSQEDLEARRYVMDLMKEIGLEVKVDPIGNICGKRTQALDTSFPSVMTGSHICTGIHYGKYDGTVGVLGGLEAIRLLNEQDITTVHPIEVVVFTAEEPQRFKAFMPGSRSMAGGLTNEDLHNYKDEAGITLWEALASAGYHPGDLVSVRRTKETVKSYVEMHIEQGRVLEDAGKRIGIVIAIAAPTRFRIVMTGRADHSGATPMGLRRDALCAAAELVLALERYAIEESTHSSVATVGDIKVGPGSIVVIPGRATMLVDIRGIEPASKRRIVKRMERKIAKICKKRGVEFDIEPIHDAEPVSLSREIIEIIKKTSEELGIDALMMPSGAGHDAQQIATFTDAGMIFVPSVRGISHNPEEYTRMEDIALGTELLTHVLLKLGGKAEQGA